MTLKYYQIDAFTQEIFKGNYAGVIVLKEWLDEQTMQNIAMENNLSETAFTVKNEEGVYELRWFSPLSEIDFCGHATLATAYVLFEQDSALNKVSFFAKAVGQLDVFKLPDGSIQMNFPARPGKKVEVYPEAITQGLSKQPTELYVNEQMYMAVYENEEDVYEMQPNLEAIKLAYPLDVSITAPSMKYDFVSRYFWPANGGDEDPVTGSLHTGLTPLWAQKLNKTTLSAYQASSRSGELLCVLEGDRVLISGYARKYLEGEIYVC